MKYEGVETEMKAGAAPPHGRGTAIAGLVFLALVAVLAALFGAGWLPRLRRQAELSAIARAAESEVPRVSIVKPRQAPASETVTLPGTMEAIQAAPIYARANGYLKRRLVDIGDRVKAGQLLAEVEAPEVEQDIRQSQAALQQARAALGQKRAAAVQARSKLSLAEVTLKRWKDLVKQGVFSAQSGDEKQSDYDAAKATVEAAEADIRVAEANIAAQEAGVMRLQEVRGFEKIVAPFDGVITARNMDAGALVTSGSASNVKEIFKLGQIDTLRIFVNVPQSLVQFVRAGAPVSVDVQEYPGRAFGGRVARTANALDPASRTLLVEVHMANPQRLLMPGMYAQVGIVAATGKPRWLVPATALLVRADGSHAVAVVDAASRVHFRKLDVGRDLGSETEATSGINGDDRLIVNPSDDLKDGTLVQLVK